MTNKTIWTLDPAHSELHFKVRHMMIANVKGAFRDFSATIESDGNDFTNASVKAVVKIDSIFTNNTDRDNHLKSPDFFDAAQYPEMVFESHTLLRMGDDNYVMTGALTMHGVTKDVVLNVEFGGVGNDPYGHYKAGFSFSGEINRTDFGLTWNALVEAGGVMVSEAVKLEGEVQFVRQ